MTNRMEQSIEERERAQDDVREIELEALDQIRGGAFFPLLRLPVLRQESLIQPPLPTDSWLKALDLPPAILRPIITQAV